MIEKPLHGLNIADAIGTAVTALDMTLLGGAGRGGAVGTQYLQEIGRAD